MQTYLFSFKIYERRLVLQYVLMFLEPPIGAVDN